MNIDKQLIESVELEENSSKCIGIVYKGIENYYIGNDSTINCKQTFKKLKRKSCKGCSDCQWEEEFLAEEIANDCFPDCRNFENGALYKLQIHSSQGYYDLYPEIDYSEFVKVKE